MKKTFLSRLVVAFTASAAAFTIIINPCLNVTTDNAIAVSQIEEKYVNPHIETTTSTIKPASDNYYADNTVVTTAVTSAVSSTTTTTVTTIPAPKFYFNVDEISVAPGESVKLDCYSYAVESYSITVEDESDKEYDFLSLKRPSDALYISCDSDAVPGTYYVKVTAKAYYGLYSSVSDTLIVNVKGNPSGDISGDGEFNGIDIFIMQSWILRQPVPTPDYAEGDMNYDGVLDVFDLVLMRK